MAIGLHPVVVARAQLGDRTAMDAVLRAVQAPLLRHLTHLLHDRDDALDVLQEVLWSVARSLADLDDPSLARAWAFRIATRRAVRAARTRGRTVPLDDVPEPHAPVADDGPIDAEALAALPRAVERLPAGCGAAIRLHYLEGLSLLEIAESLEIPLGTVKSRLSHGRALLRRELGSSQGRSTAAGPRA